MAVRDFVGTVVAGEEVEGVLIPTTVTDLVSQGLELVHVILRRRFPSKRSVRFTKIPYWDRNVKLFASRKKTTYMYDAEMFLFFFKELVVAWLPQNSTLLLEENIQYVSFSLLNFFFADVI